LTNHGESVGLVAKQ